VDWLPRLGDRLPDRTVSHTGQQGRGIAESSEPMTGIEPALQPWEGRILPLNYIDINRGREEKDGETPRPPSETPTYGGGVCLCRLVSQRTGDGNRTRTVNLASSRSTIKLRRHIGA
jgi:hypothetical protein